MTTDIQSDTSSASLSVLTFWAASFYAHPLQFFWFAIWNLLLIFVFEKHNMKNNMEKPKTTRQQRTVGAIVQSTTKNTKRH